MREIKNVSLRLSSEEYSAFDRICKVRGYSKTGKIREWIRSMIKEELPRVVASEAEWLKIEAGIREVERGEFVTFEQLKNRVRAETMGDHKNRKNSQPKHRTP